MDIGAIPLQTFLDWAISIMALAATVASVVAAVMFVRMRGNMGALEQSVETWRTLAEGQKEQIASLQAENRSLECNLSKLRGEMEGRDRFAKDWVSLVIDTVASSKLCESAAKCPNRVTPVPAAAP